MVGVIVEGVARTAQRLQSRPPRARRESRVGARCLLLEHAPTRYELDTSGQSLRSYSSQAGFLVMQGLGGARPGGRRAGEKARGGMPTFQYSDCATSVSHTARRAALLGCAGPCPSARGA